VVGSIEPGAVPSNGGPPPKKPEPAVAKATASPTPAKRDSEPILSPAARQVAADSGVDPHQLVGTGRGGRVIKEDVLNALQQRSAPPAAEVKPAPSSEASADEPEEGDDPAPGREEPEAP